MNNPMIRVNRVARRVLRPGQFIFDKWLIDLSAVRRAGPARKAIFQPIVDVRLGLVLYLEGLGGECQVWEGEEFNTGQKMRVAYLAEQRAIRFNTPSYIQQLLFCPDTVSSETVKENVPMIRINQEAEKLAQEGVVDLIIAECNSLLQWKPNTGRSERTPTWIRMEFILEPGETWEDMQRRFRSQKNNVKRVLKNGYTYRLSHAEDEFELFYDHMYVPLIQQRHVSYGSVDLKESMRKEFHEGFLFIIDDADGLPIAAQLTYLYRKTMYSISSGILNGDLELHSKGALGAIYYYSILWCYENGYERFEMGGCRPFESDGLYQYKRRWGMTPSPDLWGSRSWVFWTPNNSPAANAWFDANPVVSLDAYWKNRPEQENGRESTEAEE
jgi:hypothetical protein